jgi:hypothetical protein
MLSPDPQQSAPLSGGKSTYPTVQIPQATSMQVSFTELALADIENIRAYIAQDNPHAASRIAVAIVAAADRLSANPASAGSVRCQARLS